MDEDKLVAATLTSAILGLYGTDIKADTAFADAPDRATKVYYDCMDALAKARKEQRAARKILGEM